MEQVLLIEKMTKAVSGARNVPVRLKETCVTG
jgi:hypothetical protein